MRPVRRADEAQTDISDALDYLAERSTAAAVRLSDQLEAKCRLLSTNPFVGRAREEIAAGLRSVVVGSYVLLYSVTDAEVIVVRFLHGSRDLPAAFDTDTP
jgi:toxin ParE1/3/4